MSIRKTLFGVSALVVAVIAPTGRAVATDYKHVVMADDPAVYYEFNEPVGAIQVIDTTGKLNTDGSSRDSQFVGQRTRQKSDTAGFQLNPGTNVIFGGLGPLGTMVEFNDPTPGQGSNELTEPGAHGGYIETGLHKNFGPTATDYTIEFLYRDNRIDVGLNIQEQLVSQARPDHPDSRPGLEPDQRYIVGTGFIDNDPYDCDISPAFCDYEGGASIYLGQNRDGASYDAGEIISHYGEGGYNAADIPRAGNRNNSGVIPTQGKWIHLVQTFEAGGSLPTAQGGSGATPGNGRGVIRWYFDGVIAEENEILGSTALVSQTLDFLDKGFNDSDTPLILGAELLFFTSFYFDGFMDEFAVYDTRLDDPNGDGDMSDSRIAAHADAFAAAKAGFGSADFDYDGDVDGTDFLAWQRFVGPDTSGLDFGPSAGGDANADNLSDGADLAIWGNQFGTTTALATSTSVPEPSTGLLAGGLLTLAAIARRRVVVKC